MDIVQWLRACPCNRSKEAADEIERLTRINSDLCRKANALTIQSARDAEEIERQTNNADNLRQQVEDLTEELRVERLNHGYLREEFDELHTGAVERLRQLQATIKERDALRQNAAMAQVCLDLHDALGVRFGDDPYRGIGALRLDAERYRWLREGRMEFGVQTGMPDFATKEQCWWKVDYTPEEADAAIDAAMKEKS